MTTEVLKEEVEEGEEEKEGPTLNSLISGDDEASSEDDSR